MQLDNSFTICFVLFQGKPLGVDYFYQMNPDFLLLVVNDYLKFAPEKVIEFPPNLQNSECPNGRSLVK